MLQVKELLKLKGMTAKQLAVKLGISEGALSQQLSGNPTLEKLQAIAEALGVSVSELFASPAEGVITCPSCGAKVVITPSVASAEGCKCN